VGETAFDSIAEGVGPVGAVRFWAIVFLAGVLIPKSAIWNL